MKVNLNLKQFFSLSFKQCFLVQVTSKIFAENLFKKRKISHYFQNKEVKISHEKNIYYNQIKNGEPQNSSTFASVT